MGVAFVRVCELIYELGVNFWHMTYLNVGGGRGEREECVLSRCSHFCQKARAKQRNREKERERERTECCKEVI